MDKLVSFFRGIISARPATLGLAQPERCARRVDPLTGSVSASQGMRVPRKVPRQTAVMQKGQHPGRTGKTAIRGRRTVEKNGRLSWLASVLVSPFRNLSPLP